jgi:CHAD domain-containing protein
MPQPDRKTPAQRLADLRRALVEVLTSAAGHIEHSQDGERHVLRARTRLKRAEALAAAFEPSLKKRDALRAHKTIRRARRGLGATREATVLIETLRSLGLSPAGVATLIPASDSPSAEPHHSARDAHALRILAMRAAAWPVGPRGARRAAETIAAAYRTARRLGPKAFKSRDVDDLHDLRRRTIALAVQLAHWSEPDEKRAQAFRRLRDALGEHHDLAVAYGHILRRSWPPGGEVLDAVRTIGKRRRAARARARRAFAIAFAATPQAFAKKL